MSPFSAPSPRQIHAGIGILRVISGVIFIAHGAQKLFTYGFAGVTNAFTQMGVPFAGVAGPGVALLEFAGGILLVLGFLTRPVAAALAATMIGAIIFVHGSAGFFMPNGYEFVLALLSGAITLAVIGAGRYSIDGAIARRKTGMAA